MQTNKSLLYALCFVLGCVFAGSCTEDVNTPLENDSDAPSMISNAKVENLPGAARISYSLPKDQDLLYVEANVVKNGKPLSFRSSYYTNTILLDGFGDTNTYEVKLYAVDRSGNRSQPVSVNIQPKTPQVMETAQSMTVEPDFGGIRVSFTNHSKANLAILIYTPDSTGVMQLVDSYYTSQPVAKFASRGYKSELRKFGILVRDKWQNFSDTVSAELTPIYEVELDKSKFRKLMLPGDADASNWSGDLQYIWDGQNVESATAHTGNNPTTVPKFVSFDLGVLVKLSRFNLQTVPDDKHMYNDVSPRIYELWGRPDDPSGTDGSFDGWTKLVTIENVKPSGLPAGTLTEDDRIAGRQGDDADIPLDMPKVRYIRIRCLLNWSGNTNMVISEVTFWGNDKD